MLPTIGPVVRMSVSTVCVDTGVPMRFSLRRHYPDRFMRSAAACRHLSPRSRESPRVDSVVVRSSLYWLDARRSRNRAQWSRAARQNNSNIKRDRPSARSLCSTPGMFRWPAARCAITFSSTRRPRRNRGPSSSSGRRVNSTRSSRSHRRCAVRGLRCSISRSVGLRSTRCSSN